jgi:hypothetical protein
LQCCCRNQVNKQQQLLLMIDRKTNKITSYLMTMGGICLAQFRLRDEGRNNAVVTIQ